MDTNDTSLTGKIRGWFERSPKAQRVYERLSADLDTVVERVDSATSGLREKVAPIIDPPARTPTADQSRTVAESGEAARLGDAGQASDPVIPESESSVPPGVKRDGEPVDPTS